MSIDIKGLPSAAVEHFINRCRYSKLKMVFFMLVCAQVYARKKVFFLKTHTTLLCMRKLLKKTLIHYQIV